MTAATRIEQAIGWPIETVPTTAAEWLALPELPMPAAGKLVVMVRRLYSLRASYEECLGTELSKVVLRGSSVPLPSAIVELNDMHGTERLFRLPRGLGDWAQQCTRLMSMGNLDFPCEVTFKLMTMGVSTFEIHVSHGSFARVRTSSYSM